MEEKESLLSKIGVNYTDATYITNPAIARDEEIKQMILVLLTPDKSPILVGKPGIGKTAIVEGLAYNILRGTVPEKLKTYDVVKINVASMLGNIIVNGEEVTKLSLIVEELMELKKTILFIDEIHTLIGNGENEGLDFANMLKPAIDRGSIKLIGATTTEEYERYLVRDRAFIRRFEKIDVEEPNVATTVKIVLGTLPKIEDKTGVKFKYSLFEVEQIIKFLVNATTEYKRVFELSNRFPDIALALTAKAFSFAVFDNKKEVSIKHVYQAILDSKSIYPDVIKKELLAFRKEFKDIIDDESIEFLEDIDNTEILG